MNVAIHDSELDAMPKKTFPNLALMKISSWHKSKGDSVEWWMPLKKYDVAYSSKVFSFTPENPYLPPDTIKGGTGYGLFNELPPEIDNIRPDYSIYPKCDYAVGFITRGCPNNCDYCIVPKKEGGIKPYRNYYEISDYPRTKKLVVMDNNILASDFGQKQFSLLSIPYLKIDINQGMDITLVNDKIAKIISQIKWIKYIRFSCDKISQLQYFEKANKLFEKYGIPAHRIFIYLLVRNDLADADFRVQELHKINPKWTIYAQAERQADKRPTAQMLEFAQRYVYGRSYKKENWEEYSLKIKRRKYETFT